MRKSILVIALLTASIATAAEYEMTTYYVAFLYRGPNWTAKETEEGKAIQNAHLANIVRLHDIGKLAVAGPFTDNGDLRGIFILQNVTREEAEKLCATDPAVKAGRLRIELHPWFAAKGLRVDPPN
jgi:uncharacterized protein YciI